MKRSLSFYKLVMAAAVALPSMALADITPVAPQLDPTDNCYMIGTAAELYGFAAMVNDEGKSDVCGKLTADICLNACKEGENVLKADGTLNGDGSNFTQWTPIGTETQKFNGTFDGTGHTIRGLYFNDESTEYVGLFGYISGSTAKVQNVGVVDSYFKGYSMVGGVVGRKNLGTVSNAYNTGTVSGYDIVGGVVGANWNGTVSNAYNTGSVSGKTYVGGVVGYNDEGTVSNVYNTGTVSGTYYDVGGVVGYNEGTVSNVYNTGSVSGTAEVGGVVGANWNGTVSNVYNTGTVSGYGDVGGVVGYNDNGTVSNGFFNEEDCIENAIGGGSETADKVKGLSMTDLANLTVGYRGDFPLLKGETESPWAKGIYYDKATGKLANSELPYLKSLPKPQDVEMEFNVKDNVIQISSTDDLKNFAKLVNEYHITDVDAELTTNLTVNSNLLGENNANVDAETGEYKGSAPANVWTPIGTNDNRYTGTFDGKGYTVSGLYFNDENTNYVGLFGYIDESAKVQNVGVVDSYLKGYSMVGGVVGGNDGGSISNVYNTGIVSGSGDDVGGVVGENSNGTVSNVYNTGIVSGNYYVGGVVGVNGGTVSNVYNTGAVSGETFVGGVVGFNGGTVSNVYNTGSVSGTGFCVSGVVGTNDGTVSNGFFNTEVTCENCDVVGDATGMSSAKFADGTVAMLLHDWCEMDGETCKEGGLNGSVWGQDVTKENSKPEFIERLDYKMGGMTFFELAGKIDSAYVDAASDIAVNFPNDVVVSGPVKFKRTFSGSGYSTIMLPFTPNCTDDDCVEGVKFFEFNSYTDGEVQATEVSPKDLKANTPYLVQVAGASEIVFKNGGTFNTTSGGAYDPETGIYKVALTGDGAGWTIYGTYDYKTWEEGDAGLGRTYGFAANDGVNDPSIVGKFAKIAAGAYIYPMRAYLEYTAPAALARPAANGEIRTVASLPDEIEVVIVEKGETGTEIAGSDDASVEQTTKVIGTINTRTGEFKFADDRWFDLNGRYLGVKKPTQKGAYYNNGKKVIVK